jgi:hypothetical protein
MKLKGDNPMKIWTQFLFVATALVPQVAGAQTPNPSATLPLGLPATAVPLAGQYAVLASVALVVGATLVFLAIGKAHDFWSKRKEQAAELEGRINGALFEHLVFLRTSVAPTIRMPFRKNAPVTIVLRGEVPSPQLEQSALRLVGETVSRVRSDYAIENQMAVVPPSGSRAVSAAGDVQKAGRLVGALKTLASVVGVMAGVILVKYVVLIEHLNLR